MSLPTSDGLLHRSIFHCGVYFFSFLIFVVKMKVHCVLLLTKPGECKLSEQKMRHALLVQVSRQNVAGISPDKYCLHNRLSAGSIRNHKEQYTCYSCYTQNTHHDTRHTTTNIFQHHHVSSHESDLYHLLS